MAEGGKPTPPPGIVPIMMTLKQMKERYNLMYSDNLTDTVSYKIFNKSEVLDEVLRDGFYSAFHPVREEVKVGNGRGESN